MNPYERLLAAVTGPTWFGTIGRNVVTPLDRRLHGSRFAPTRLGTSLPLCFLTTTGNKSGEPRRTPLLYIIDDKGSPAVVATNWGGQHHPGWSFNLEADPVATVEIAGSASPVVARRATGDELARLWSAFIARWPNYAKYRDRADRDIRMYVLDPAA